MTLYHGSDHGSEGAFILGTSHWEDYVYTSHEVMPRNFRHVGKAEKFELFLVVCSLYLHLVKLIFFLSILRAISFVLQNVLMLFGDGD